MREPFTLLNAKLSSNDLRLFEGYRSACLHLQEIKAILLLWEPQGGSRRPPFPVAHLPVGSFYLLGNSKLCSHFCSKDQIICKIMCWPTLVWYVKHDKKSWIYAFAVKYRRINVNIFQNIFENTCHTCTHTKNNAKEIIPNTNTT